MHNHKRFAKLSVISVFLIVSQGVSAADGNPHYVEGELLVKYRSTSKLGSQSSALRQKMRSKDQFSALGVEHWKLPADLNTNEVLQQLKKDPAVDIVEPNYRRYPRVSPEETGFSNAQARLDQVRLQELWQKPLTKFDKVKIAVIDDAFDIDHPDLSANIVLSYDGLDKDDDPRPEVCLDEKGQPVVNELTGSNTEDHGTEVLGVVGAVRGNGIGFDGAGDNASIYPIRIGCQYTVAAELAAVEWAIQQDVDIISVSYGGPMFSELERRAFENALAKEIIVVVAAGNADMDNDRVTDYPSGLDLPNILAVAATDEANELARWSQWGQTTVDVAAPGVRFDTTYHASPNNTGDRYVTSIGGTSFSAPLVSGILASLMSRDPYPAAEGLVFRAKAALMQSVKPFTTTAKARLATDGYVDALAAYEKYPKENYGPVIVIKSVSIDDSETGNGNGEVDPDEIVKIQLVLENQGNDATDFNATVSSSSLPAFNESIQGNISGYKATNHSYGLLETSFVVDFGDLTQQQNILFKLDITGSYFLGIESFATTRYFSLDTGSLKNGVGVNSIIRKNDDNQDELHYYHIDVPVNGKKLKISLTTKENAGRANDLDLLVKRGSVPQFDYIDYPLHNSLHDAVEDDVLVSASRNVTEEVIEISSADAGTYHIVVVANENDTQSNIEYTIKAEYDSGSPTRVAGCALGSSKVFDPFLLLLALIASFKLFVFRNRSFFKV